MRQNPDIYALGQYQKAWPNMAPWAGMLEAGANSAKQFGSKVFNKARENLRTPK